MYDYLLRRNRKIGDLNQPAHDPALAHSGDYHRLLRVHTAHAASLASVKAPPEMIAPFLLKRICDARTLRCSFDALRSEGGQAPGPNGMVLKDLDNSAAWSLCKALAEALRSGHYQPGPDRQVKISKGPGRGFRTLTIQNAEDRMVGKAILLVLQPVIDPTFQWFSMGFRPHRGTPHALAAAMTIARLEQRAVVVCADVKAAFDKVPFARLIDACRRQLPPEIVELIRLVSDSGGKHGIRQGSPLSPFLWNVFADRFIDQPFIAKSMPGRLVRYADDLLLLCRSRAEADDVLPKLTCLARSAGTPLKSGAEVAALDAGESVRWLGYQLQGSPAGWAVTIAPEAWERLADDLSATHMAPAAPLHAIETIKGWLDYLGPSYEFEDRRKVISRIREQADACGFSEIPTRRRLEAWWQEAWEQWRRVLGETERQLFYRLSGCPKAEVGHKGQSIRMDESSVADTMSTAAPQSAYDATGGQELLVETAPM